MGHEEIPHTADCAIRVWAPDFVSLLVEAAVGMNFVAGARLGGGPRSKRLVDLHAADGEGLLVQFLSELIFYQETEEMAFDNFELELTATRLTGAIWGSELGGLVKPIKAVTYHELNIRESSRGLEAQLVFDV